MGRVAQTTMEALVIWREGDRAPWPPPWMFLLVFVTAFALFANSIPNGFTLDDLTIVEKNKTIRRLDRLPDIWGSGYWGEEKVTRAYRPVTVTTFALNHAIHGRAPAGYHLVNVFLHALNSVLVLLLSCRIGVPLAGALFAALAFAVHPIHTEPVAGVVGRSELLASFMFILGFLLWLRFRRSGGFMNLAGVAGAYGVGILCKEQVIMLPAILVGSELAFHRLRDPEGRNRLLKVLVACGCALAIDLFLRYAATGSVVEGRLLSIQSYPGLLFGEPVWIRILTFLEILSRMTRLLFFPIALLPDYSFNQIPIPRALQTGVAMGGLIAVACAWGAIRAWSVPRRFVMILWAAAVYFPISNLVVPITLLFGERTLYLPSVGLAVILGDWFVTRSPSLFRTAPWISSLLVLLVLSLWGVRTVDRNVDWRDQRALFAKAVKTSPASARSRLNYGVELLKVGDVEQAIVELQGASRILPSYAKAHLNLSIAYERLDRVKEAEAAVRRSIFLRSNQSMAWTLLGRLLARGERVGEAKQAFRRALALNPKSTESRMRLEEIEAVEAVTAR